MQRVKLKKVTLAFLIFVIYFSFFIAFSTNISLAQYKENTQKLTDWNTRITSDTKELISEETEEIFFHVQDNPNVAKGKIAPGSIATAVIELDLTKNKYVVDFNMQADTTLLPKQFELTATIDGIPYLFGNTRIYNETSSIKEIKLQLE